MLLRKCESEIDDGFDGVRLVKEGWSGVQGGRLLIDGPTAKSRFAEILIKNNSKIVIIEK